MTNNDKSVWDGIILVASYHFLLALVSLLGAAAIVVFAIIPNASNQSNPQSIFFPIIGVFIGLILCAWYGFIGAGLTALKNSARMSAVFLALFGTVGGLFILLGAGIPAINSLIPDWAAVGGIVIAGLCGYFMTTVLDIAVLFFLFSRRVRAVFYGEPWNPETAGPSFGSRVRSVFMGEPMEMEPPAVATPRHVTHREPPPPQNPPEDLDTPGSLFTEPAPRKR